MFSPHQGLVLFCALVMGCDVASAQRAGTALSNSELTTITGRITAVDMGRSLSVDVRQPEPLTVWLDDNTECVKLADDSSQTPRRVSAQSLRSGEEISILGETSADGKRILARSIRVQPAAGVSAAPSSRDRARNVMMRALTEYTKSRNEAALQQALTSAINLDPSYPDAYFNLGVLAEGHEAWPYALALLGVAVQSSPADSPIHKRAERQIATIRAIQKNDATPEGRTRRLYAAAVARATIFLDNGLLQAAVAESAIAAKIDPRSWEAYAIVADALLLGKRPVESQKFLNMAIARAPADVQKELRSRAASAGTK